MLVAMVRLYQIKMDLYLLFAEKTDLDYITRKIIYIDLRMQHAYTTIINVITAILYKFNIHEYRNK